VYSPAAFSVPESVPSMRSVTPAGSAPPTRDHSIVLVSPLSAVSLVV
jgi:hypothetical protein